mmetsp:Transcript_32902/g.48247  ORF Transcript_32902/g.48247 Transcript_32902/m.48247 type:complete len:338 (+) Transcript_32902:107-1120(+)|eukprot:CAMPEP_0195518530 /NCGR_PEP_ID=MMETSP0794_2-20130614/13091_1 /TAXON_ID=515487 /ORGANISM="Stephanopyxis turris, Strain CCMP 815" /LENGTH=337 /DNA_ID=CAMNT_0040647511 /DNA_START=101 /DNA_END=1114 /DNA_ORIENTATION=-
MVRKLLLHIPLLLIIFPLSLLVCGPILGSAASETTTERGFDAFDSNHDGQINREEYDRGLKKLTSFLEMDIVSSKGSISNLLHRDMRISAGNADKTSEGEEDLSFWSGFVNSCAMIIATEIGDKTFFIAAVLSMRNSRLVVFLGALLALICMTILSSMMGLILPSLLPRQYTHIIGGVLFLYFGVKLIFDSRSMTHKVSEELEEVEEELRLGSNKKEDEDSTSNSDVENHTNAMAQNKKQDNLALGAPSNEKLFVQSFTLTFLAEWGDRSQIATIALASHKDPYGVTVGGCLGHSLCTGLAVVGGRMLAARISEKTVSFGGGIIFLLFGLHSLFFEA